MPSLLGNNLYLSDLKKAISDFDFTPFAKKTVLITGGLGLIGSALADVLHIANEVEGVNIRIVIAARDGAKYTEAYGGLGDFSFLKYDALNPLDSGLGVDYLVHAAGIATPKMYVDKPVETFTTNFIGTKNVLEAMARGAVRKALYISSSEVYGSNDVSGAHSEDCFGAVKTNDVRASYSESKRASEVLCFSYAKEYGLDIAIARPGHIYGPNISRPDERISSDFIRKAALGEELVLKSAGLQKRSYCYSIDCAMAMLCILARGNAGEAYNIGSEQSTTIRRMAEIVSSVGGVDLQSSEPTEAERRAFNPMNDSSLGINKIKRLGYRDAFTPEEGLGHSVQVYREVFC